ncbi:MAG: WD40 repeat domain-containing protein, partial [Gemmataceae bacterium]|nr:WD40 repeat domain-containing protein [Gemmataceae bacterium]
MTRPAAGLGSLLILSAPAFAGLPPPAVPKLDAHGHPLPPGAIARLGDFARRYGHGHGLTFSPDGKLVAHSRTVGTDIREAATGRAVTPAWVRLARGHVRFTPAGDLLHCDHAAGVFLVRRPDTGAVVLDLSAAGKEVAEVTDVPGEGFVAVVGYNTPGCHLRLFTRAEGARPEGRVIAAPYLGRYFQLCPGGRWVVATDLHTGTGVRVFDPATGKELFLHLFDPQNDPKSWISTFLPLPDGDTVLVALGDRVVPLRLGAKAAEEGTPIPLARVGGLRLAADGKTVLATDHAGETWRLNWPGGVPEPAPAAGPKPADGWWRAATSPDERRAVLVHRYRPSRLVDTATGRTVHEYAGLSPVIRLVARPGGRVLVYDDGGMREYDLPSGALRQDRRFPDLPPGEWPLDVSPDGRLFAVGCEGLTVRLSIRETATGRERWQLPGRFLTSGSVFDPSGRAVCDPAEGGPAKYDSESGKPLPDPLPAGTVSPDGRLEVRRALLPIPVIERATGRPRLALDGPRITGNQPAAEQFRFSADGRYLAGFGSPLGAVVWSLADGSVLHLGTERNPAGDLIAGDLSPDGRWLATFGSSHLRGRVRVWDWAAPRGQARDIWLPTADWHPRVVTFTPDGKYLLTGGFDGTVLVWDVARFADRSRARPDRADPDDLWGELGGDDAEAAGRAVAALVRRPAAAVGLARRNLPPAVTPPPEELAVLVAD